MNRNPSSANALATVLLLAVALSGCGGGGDGGGSPTPTGGTTPTTGTPPPTQEPIPPGNAYNANSTFLVNAAIAQVSFTVSDNWSKLTFSAQLWKKAQCAVLQSDPPAGAGTGPAPQVIITTPANTKLTNMALGSFNFCDTTATATKVGTPPSPQEVPNQMGTWKIDFTGRGTNIDVQVTAAGK